MSKPSVDPLARLKTLEASVTAVPSARLSVAALATLTVPMTSLEVKPFFRVPSETVMVPALPMLTVPEISRVPVPSFVTVVSVPVTPPVTVTLPEPAKVSALVPAATAVALSRVSVPASDWIVASAFKVTVPPKKLVPERLRRAPLVAEPVPLRPRASAPTVMPPWSSSEAMAPTVVPPAMVPKAVAWEIDRMPALTNVVPS